MGGGLPVGIFEFIIILVFIKSVTELVKMLARGGERREQQKALAEVEALRAEVGALRREHQDAILSFDSTLDRVDRRLGHLETLEQQRLPGGEPTGGVLRAARQ